MSMRVFASAYVLPRPSRYRPPITPEARKTSGPQATRRSAQRRPNSPPTTAMPMRMKRDVQVVDRVVAPVADQPDPEQVPVVGRVGQVAERVRAPRGGRGQHVAGDLVGGRDVGQHRIGEQQGHRDDAADTRELAPVAAAQDVAHEHEGQRHHRDAEERHGRRPERCDARHGGDRERQQRAPADAAAQPAADESNEERDARQRADLLDRALEREAEHQRGHRRARGSRGDDPARAHPGRREAVERERGHDRREAQERLVEPREVDGAQRCQHAQRRLAADRIGGVDVALHRAVERAREIRVVVAAVVGEELGQRELMPGVAQQRVALEGRVAGEDGGGPEHDGDQSCRAERPRLGAQREQPRAAEHEPGDRKDDLRRQRQPRGRALVGEDQSDDDRRGKPDRQEQHAVHPRPREPLHEQPEAERHQREGRREQQPGRKQRHRRERLAPAAQAEDGEQERREEDLDADDDRASPPGPRGAPRRARRSRGRSRCTTITPPIDEAGERRSRRRAAGRARAGSARACGRTTGRARP